MLESQKDEAELDLTENLQPELDNILSQQGGAGGSTGQSTRLRECERALDAVNQTIAGLDQQIQEIDAQIEDIRAQLSELENSRNEKEASNRQLAKAMARQEQAMSKKDSDRSRYTDRLAEVKRDIRDLGTLPEDVNRKYTRWDTTKVSFTFASSNLHTADITTRLPKNSPRPTKPSRASPTSTRKHSNITRTLRVSDVPSPNAAPNWTHHANPSRISSMC